LTMVRERRSFTRITVDIPGSISLYQVEAYHTGPITNISLTGCFFQFDGELPVGEPCSVAITVGEGLETERITVAGIVARSDAQGAGISFTEYSAECRRQLEKIISSQRAARQAQINDSFGAVRRYN
jgi:PilZ domain